MTAPRAPRIRSPGPRTGWLGALALLGALGLACAARPGPPPGDPLTRPIEREIVRLTNDYRRAHALPPLREAGPLAGLARGHSGSMARSGRKIDHDGFRKRFRLASRSLPLTRFAENVARMGRARPSPAEWVVARWIESPVHREHLEGPFELIGVGVARSESGALYFTQLFATPRSP